MAGLNNFLLLSCYFHQSFPGQSRCPRPLGLPVEESLISRFQVFISGRLTGIVLTFCINVYTIVSIMNKYIATVVKTGNSLALRVPKSYADESHLSPGDKVYLGPAIKQKKTDPATLKATLANLVQAKPYSELSDPVAWQRAERQDRELV
jgi:antitoxin component of MazEF toxin-antitoxin module